jgi:hypothetical protein
MTTDLKAQILAKIELAQAHADDKSCDPYAWQDACFEYITQALTLLQDPNVFVGKWDTNVEKNRVEAALDWYFVVGSTYVHEKALHRLLPVIDKMQDILEITSPPKETK